MACASCSRKTLSIFIDSILTARMQSVRLSSARGSSYHRSQRSLLTTQQRTYHRTPTNLHDSNLKPHDQTRTDDSYIPFDSVVDVAKPKDQLMTALPGPFTRPPVPEPLQDVEAPADTQNGFEPDIEVYGDLRGEDPRNIETGTGSNLSNLAEMGEHVGGPVRMIEYDRQPADRMARKERNREAIAARRRARAAGEELPSAEQLKQDLNKLDEISTRMKTSETFLKKSKETQAPRHEISKAAGTAKRLPAMAEKKKLESWQIQKGALQDKFKDEGWNPRKKLSPEALEGIRALHAQYPDHFTTPALAEQFKVSPEAIRRILKSKWRPNGEEEEKRMRRWDKRGEKIWTQKVEEGVHPPKKWREMGIGGGPRRQAQDRSMQRSKAQFVRRDVAKTTSTNIASAEVDEYSWLSSKMADADK
ncbi:hypothetical protein FH972_023101 [Carpinus fangiana]|uniref:Required for respiratory growth protein 9, mitochondrial n=1 Tax=Carpinus fangiana TaxID=176857 RepID=A0A5N6KU72_9ROSI|nr:hypothetical protein FH972_023101 [Carpinus fangiana]